MAEDRLGELLAATDRAKGGQPEKVKSTGNRRLPVLSTTLSDLGITKRESANAQALYALPEGLKQQVIKGEMLTASADKRAKGTKGQLKGREPSGGNRRLPPEKTEPTLEDLGLTRRESAGAAGRIKAAGHRRRDAQAQGAADAEANVVYVFQTAKCVEALERERPRP